MSLPESPHEEGCECAWCSPEETWPDDYEEILAKWRADPANLEPWFAGSSDG